MMVRRLLFGLFVVLIVGGGTVAAQEGLTDSDPEPNAVLPVPPERVIVTFNGPVRTWSLRVLDSTAEAVYGGPGDLLRPQTVAALLPALPPGSYTVTYEAELEDGSSVAGSYRFRVRPVPQDIDFRTPTDGETVTPGTIPVEVVTMGAEAPTISLSINGEPVDSFSGSVVIDEPGVYTLEASLADSPVTEQVTIAVAEPTVQPGPPQTGTIAVTNAQRIGAVAATAALLVLGFWLARTTARG